jgi:hypothetical protein
LGILAMKVLAIWSLVALVSGVILGAAIRKSERTHRDEFLDALFSTLETWQASRY